MYKANPVGYHCKLTIEKKKEIIDNVEGNYVIGQIARMSRIHKQTLQSWLRKGEDHLLSGDDTFKETIFAQLFIELEFKRGEAIKEMLADVKARATNWQATWELLKSIAKEDFGVESGEYKELLEMFTKLSDTFRRYSESPHKTHGGVSNGGEMDSESHIEEQGSVTQEAESESRQTNTSEEA